MKNNTKKAIMAGIVIGAIATAAVGIAIALRNLNKPKATVHLFVMQEQDPDKIEEILPKEPGHAK